MNHRVFYAAGNSPVMIFAQRQLELWGADVRREPGNYVTHLLLPAPCRIPQEELRRTLDTLPEEITVFGDVPGYNCIDLLQDPQYLAQNAQITAYCAVKLAANALSVVWEGCPVLIVGWGRIGKCLSRLLKANGAAVTVAARKESDRAMIHALGYEAEDTAKLDFILRRYRVIFNTVPSPVLSEAQMAHCRPDCLKYELASTPGMFGNDIIDARGLPGKYAPESSGKLIARTILRLCAQKEVGL